MTLELLTPAIVMIVTNLQPSVEVMGGNCYARWMQDIKSMSLGSDFWMGFEETVPFGRP